MRNVKGYTPMSETEQEALSRIIEENDIVLEVDGYGEMPLGEVILGDHRLGIPFQITFTTANNSIQTVPYLDLRLKRRSTGTLLFKERQAFKDIHGNPMMVSTGLTVPMQWDIGINMIEPEVVREILPRQSGLTTRHGNERLTPEQMAHRAKLREGEARARQSTKDQIADSVAKAKKAT